MSGDKILWSPEIGATFGLNCSPHGWVATCFDDLDGSLVILVQFKMYGTTADFVKNIHGRKTNGAQGEVSCCELRLWRAVTNN